MAAKPDVGAFGWGDILNAYLLEQETLRGDHAAATAAHGATGAVVGTTNTQTLTNKTLTAPAISNPVITGVRQVLRARKAASTARSSTVTLADDPHLTVAIPAAGTYAISAVLRVGPGGAGANGKFKVAFTHPGGTFVTSGNGPVATLTTGSSASTEAISRSDAASPTTATAFGVSDTASTYVTVLLECEYVASAAGDLTLQWAQNASNAITTVLDVGSTLRVERTA